MIHFPSSGKPWSGLTAREQRAFIDKETSFLCGEYWSWNGNACFDPYNELEVNCTGCILSAFSKGMKIAHE